MFEESLNQVTQEKQIDVHVRYWQGTHICSRFVCLFIGCLMAHPELGHIGPTLEVDAI
jgi:hypothetical protein